MTISQPRALLLGLSLALAACGGEGLVLPPDGAAANIEVMSGNGQSGRVGSTLADSLVVKVTDTQDRPVAGANVVFEFTADGSASSPATASTDGDGRAASRLVLGTRVGPVTGVVRVPVDAGVTPVEAPIEATAFSDNANGISLLSGNDQLGPVGTTLPAPLVVAVADAFGNPIPNVAIEWSVTVGSVSAPTTVTGANGQASVTRTLGPIAGPQTTLATAAGLAGSPVTFAHTATPGTATGVVKVSGDEQSALAGTQLTNPLVVQVLDDQQNPIAGRAVTWIVTAGGGQVPAENTTTDPQGFASTSWTLGPAAGPNSLNAVVSGVGTATFTATATAGTPSASTSTVSASPGTINSGTGSSTITVTVRDAGNNPVAGAAVTPASSGSENTFTPASATSGSNGVATFSFSSTVAETKTITATAGGVAITDPATVTVQRVSSTVEITSDDPDPSSVNQQITVEFSVMGAGGTPTGVVTITVGGGTETCAESLTDGSGACTLTLLVPGTGANSRRVITASYGGDSRFAPDTDTENHRVDPLPNQAPTAGSDTYETDEEVTLNVAAPEGVLVNDDDPEGAPLTAAIVSNPTRGDLVLNADGSFVYTPFVDLAGADQFTYNARDPAGNTTSATVTINVTPVNDPPVAAFAPPSCSAGVPCTFEAMNDDPDSGDTWTYDWDFGDGSDHGTGSGPSHTYQAAGPVMVTLTITDQAGAVGSHQDSFTVNP